jgi:hypothetical protein
MQSYDRYSLFRNEDSIGFIPIITLDKKNTDYYEIYKAGQTRLDILSNKYYGNPSYGWLILLANQDCSSMEYEIEDEIEIRIPYPLEVTIAEYREKVELYNKIN